jgi:acetoin utilization deacetylase AcuC-like enzyme
LILVSHADFARLHPTGEHPERPERLAVLHERFTDFEQPERASELQLGYVHDPDYVRLVRETSESGRTVMLDPDTVCTPSSYETARLAAGAAIAAVERSGFALARPPGHHALPARAMGFCLFNNIAVAVRVAQIELGLERVAILDWDVHHGNGTQDTFWSDESVLFVSLHQWPFYPGTGGPGEGNETTLNVPLEAGSGDEAYLEAFETLVEPRVRSFEPELLLVSAGFDAAAGDPIGGMSVSEKGFSELARRAGSLCERWSFVLEGGYNLATLPGLVAAVVEA